MKTLKISLVSASILLAGTLMAQPQGGGQGKGNKMTSEEKAIKQTEVISEKLQLDEKKKAEVLEINQRFQASTEEIQDRHKQEMKAEMKEVKEARDAELKEVLSPEEFKQMKEFEAERRAAAKGQQGKGKGPGPKK